MGVSFQFSKSLVSAELSPSVSTSLKVRESDILYLLYLSSPFVFMYCKRLTSFTLSTFSFVHFASLNSFYCLHYLIIFLFVKKSSSLFLPKTNYNLFVCHFRSVPTRLSHPYFWLQNSICFFVYLFVCLFIFWLSVCWFVCPFPCLFLIKIRLSFHLVKYFNSWLISLLFVTNNKKLILLWT
jgi:hypothetical protein